MPRKAKDDTPPGGWMGPPDMDRVPPEAIGVGKQLKKCKLTKEDMKKREKFFKRMRKNDKKGIWR